MAQSKTTPGTFLLGKDGIEYVYYIILDSDGALDDRIEHATVVVNIQFV